MKKNKEEEKKKKWKEKWKKEEKREKEGEEIEEKWKEKRKQIYFFYILSIKKFKIIILPYILKYPYQNYS